MGPDCFLRLLSYGVAVHFAAASELITDVDLNAAVHMLAYKTDSFAAPAQVEVATMYAFGVLVGAAMLVLTGIVMGKCRSRSFAACLLLYALSSLKPKSACNKCVISKKDRRRPFSLKSTLEKCELGRPHRETSWNAEQFILTPATLAPKKGQCTPFFRAQPTKASPQPRRALLALSPNFRHTQNAPSPRRHFMLRQPDVWHQVKTEDSSPPPSLLACHAAPQGDAGRKKPDIHFEKLLEFKLDAVEEDEGDEVMPEDWQVQQRAPPALSGDPMDGPEVGCPPLKLALPQSEVQPAHLALGRSIFIRNDAPWWNGRNFSGKRRGNRGKRRGKHSESSSDDEEEEDDEINFGPVVEEEYRTMKNEWPKARTCSA